jgi:hypothetical protein
MKSMARKLRLSIAISLLAMSVDVFAGPVTVGPNDSWRFKNPRNELATNMEILSGGVSLSCDGSSGGPAFDMCSQGLANGLHFFIGSGANQGTGVAANSDYIVNFQDFDVGTTFSVSFSYGGENVIDISVVTDFGYIGQFDPAYPQGNFNTDALVQGIPEPSTAPLVLLAVIGCVLAKRQKRKSS